MLVRYYTGKGSHSHTCVCTSCYCCLASLKHWASVFNAREAESQGAPNGPHVFTSRWRFGQRHHIRDAAPDFSSDLRDQGFESSDNGQFLLVVASGAVALTMCTRGSGAVAMIYMDETEVAPLTSLT